jgi:hypothetical protein
MWVRGSKNGSKDRKNKPDRGCRDSTKSQKRESDIFIFGKMRKSISKNGY